MIEILNFIGGRLVPPSAGKYLDSFDPSTGQVNARVPDSDGDDVDAAVEAARGAFAEWSQATPKRRSQVLLEIAAGIEARLEEFAELESRDQGKPLTLARRVDVPRAVYNFRFFASAILHDTSTCTKLMGVPGGSSSALNYVDRVPVGVAGLISPWNLPLYLLTWKIAPAIAFGNTCVAKPSEVTSATAHLLCQVIIGSTSLPPGVVNVVFGTGPRAGAHLVAHRSVPLVSFTGSTAVGKAIIRASAERCKKLSLELGGKNAAIVFPDADLERHVTTMVRSAFANQGEVCLCTSRILVHRSVYDRFVELYVAAVRRLKVGAPGHPSTDVGALVSREHRDKVRRYIDMARRDGAEMLCGGDDVTLPAGDGFFVAPTVIAGLPDDHPCMTDEIFGPVTCLTRFSDEDEAIARANAVEYGLCASVYTADVERAHRVAHKIEAGTVWVNSWLIRDLHMPFGGMKMSGVGREGLEDSKKFFTEAKTVCVPF